MSELQKPAWFDIPRETPHYAVNIAGEEAFFTYGNTMCYFFSDRWAQFNHVFYRRENNLSTYLFNVEDCMTQLQELGYPACYQEYPSQEDVEAYIEAEMREI
jgi:hypothetical protein